MAPPCNLASYDAATSRNCLRLLGAEFAHAARMSSINQQQAEQYHQNFSGPDAVAKIRELAEGASTCFFCTAITTGAPISTRPMAVQQVDDEGCLWFLCAIDSQQNAQLAQDDLVQLMFQGSSHSDFLTLHGRATVTT